MNNPRLLPQGADNPFTHHPGFESQDCLIQYVVDPPWGSSVVYPGFGCQMTGGHCVPGAHCTARRAEAARQDALQAALGLPVAFS